MQGHLDESDIIISGALAQSAGQNLTKMHFTGESNAERQHQDRSVSSYSDSFVLAGLCTSAGCEGSLSGHGSSRPVFDSGREG
jgi:hypothetical protein